MKSIVFSFLLLLGTYHKNPAQKAGPCHMFGMRLGTFIDIDEHHSVNYCKGNRDTRAAVIALGYDSKPTILFDNPYLGDLATSEEIIGKGIALALAGPKDFLMRGEFVCNLKSCDSPKWICLNPISPKDDPYYKKLEDRREKAKKINCHQFNIEKLSLKYTSDEYKTCVIHDHDLVQIFEYAMYGGEKGQSFFKETPKTFLLDPESDTDPTSWGALDTYSQYNAMLDLLIEQKCIQPKKSS
jgi:hypothetical protein